MTAPGPTMIDPLPVTPRHPAQPPPSTQVETSDYFLPVVAAFLCKQCRQVRFAAWRDSGLCDWCVPPPMGGFRCSDTGEAPREAVTGYTAPGRAQPARECTLPPALQLHGDIEFAGVISFVPPVARAWG